MQPSWTSAQGWKAGDESPCDDFLAPAPMGSGVTGTGVYIHRFEGSFPCILTSLLPRIEKNMKRANGEAEDGRANKTSKRCPGDALAPPSICISGAAACTVAEMVGAQGALGPRDMLTLAACSKQLLGLFRGTALALNEMEAFPEWTVPVRLYAPDMARLEPRVKVEVSKPEELDSEEFKATGNAPVVMSSELPVDSIVNAEPGRERDALLERIHQAMFEELENFVLRESRMPSLKRVVLRIGKGAVLKELPGRIESVTLVGECENLPFSESCDLSGVTEMHVLSESISSLNLGAFRNLRRLHVRGLTRLKAVSAPPDSLKELYIANCARFEAIERLPDGLEVLHLEGLESLVSLPRSAPGLSVIKITGCEKLSHLPGVDAAPRVLELHFCESVSEIPMCTSSIETLYLGCTGVVEVPLVPRVKHLHLEGGFSRTRWTHEFSRTPEVRTVYMNRVEGLPSRIPSMPLLEILNLSLNADLKTMEGSFPHLEILYMDGMAMLASVTGTYPKLNSIELWSCPGLTNVPKELPELRSIAAQECRRLKIRTQRYEKLERIEIVLNGVEVLKHGPL
jgi:hypothetical protein